MQQLVMRSRFVRLAGTTALLAALAAPAATDPVYAWRTEDGGYAFTDDPKAIPPRYRNQAKLREGTRLGDYARYTPSDDAATQRYSEQLSRRLEHLRRVNAAPLVAGPLVASTPAVTPSVTMNSNNGYTPGVEIAAGAGAGADEPIVVETLFTRPEGKMVTRQTTVVRQGDRTLSIVKPRLREWNVADDIHDEAELER